MSLPFDPAIPGATHGKDISHSLDFELTANFNIGIPPATSPIARSRQTADRIAIQTEALPGFSLLLIACALIPMVYTSAVSMALLVWWIKIASQGYENDIAVPTSRITRCERTD